MKDNININHHPINHTDHSPVRPNVKLPTSQLKMLPINDHNRISVCKFSPDDKYDNSGSPPKQ
jgi:hypothetical protein